MSKYKLFRGEFCNNTWTTPRDNTITWCDDVTAGAPRAGASERMAS